MAKKHTARWACSAVKFEFNTDLSVTGLTANATILDHAIKNSASYDATIHEKLKEGKSSGQSSANS